MLPRSSVAVTACAMAITAIVTVAQPRAPVSAFAPADGEVFINEIHYDNAGADAGESVEVAGPAATSLDGWRLVPYNGNGGGTYSPIVTLSGALPDQDGGFGTVSVPIPGLQNGSPDGIALVDGGGTVRQFLSYEGTFTATNGQASGLTSTDIGTAETGSEPAGRSLGLTGEGQVYGDFTWAPTTASFGAVNAGQSFSGPVEPPPTVCPAPPAISPISTVQGRTDVSPCAGETVTVEGVVVGDYEGPSPTLRGFYVQQPDGSHDADPATSEGIFVFNASNDSVALGDRVRVSGTVAEFQGQTQIGAITIVPVAEDVAVAATSASLPLPDATHLERFEGMLVSFPQTLAVTEHFQLGRFGQVVVSSESRLAQPTNIVEPGAPAQALQAQNDLDRLIVDDATNQQNPDPIVLGRGGQPLTATNTLRGGDTVTGAVGVLTYTWAGNSASGNAYRLRVQGDLSDSGLVPGGVIPDFQASNPRPGGPPEVPGSLRVASLNVLNYFLTLDTGGNLCGPDGHQQGCRGADTGDELARQRTKLLAAISKLDADVVGLVELENTTGVEPLADIVAGLDESAGAGAYGYIETGTIGTDAIKVGLIYRTAAVFPLGDHAILDSSVDPDFVDTRNRPSLAQSFVERSSGQVFTVVVNHLKSKGCGDASGLDADQGDGQGCWNATRTAAAGALVDWLASDPTSVGDTDRLVVGDLNSYAKEDPIDELAGAGYVDLGEQFGDGYSYVFDGQWGTLDYALASPSLAGQVRGAVEYHISADEPSVLDYNVEFKSDGQIDSLYAPDELRASDHDPIVTGIDLASRRPRSVVAPPALRPANGRYRRVRVLAARSWSVDIVGATSSEADSGLGPGDRPNDIVMLGGRRILLRAERFSPAGRTYTLHVAFTRDGQTVLQEELVTVPRRHRHS